MFTDRPQFWRLSRFTELEDTPSTFLGQGLKLLQINALETKLAPVVQVRNFLQLDDTPASFIGHANRLVRVNPLANALDFTDPVAPGITSGWELIRTGTFTGDINITGLDGNADRLWMLVIRGIHTAGWSIGIRFNTDGAANYNQRQHFFGAAGGVSRHDLSIGSGVFMINPAQFNFWNKFMIFMILPVVSGQRRLVLTECNETNNDVSNEIKVSGLGNWTNTTDNIHTINIISHPITAGEFFLFRRR